MWGGGGEGRGWKEKRERGDEGGGRERGGEGMKRGGKYFLFCSLFFSFFCLCFYFFISFLFLFFFFSSSCYNCCYVYLYIKYIHTQKHR